MVRNSAGKADCVAVKRRWCGFTIGIVALGKWPAGGGRDVERREGRGAWGLRAVRVTVVIEVHSPQCTVQTRLLTDDEGAKNLPCCTDHIRLVG